MRARIGSDPIHMPTVLPETLKPRHLHMPVRHAKVNGPWHFLSRIKRPRRRRCNCRMPCYRAPRHARCSRFAIVQIVGGRVRLHRPHVRPNAVHKDWRRRGITNGRLALEKIRKSVVSEIEFCVHHRRIQPAIQGVAAVGLHGGRTIPRPRIYRRAADRGAGENSTGAGAVGQTSAFLCPDKSAINSAIQTECTDG